jgi:beta-galactosidase
VKLVGYNYGEKLYESHHAAHPDWVIFGAETCSTVQSRGVYHFPLSQSVLSDDDMQCSALGNSTTSWGAKSVEDCVLFDQKTPYSLGQFLWAGQDYLGEPTPYHTKSAYLGHVDTAGFPKDSYYVIQAGWTDVRTAPMVHLFPYWDFSPGQMIDVRAATNAPSVELFLDGESLGRREPAGRLIADWCVPYRPGTLIAVAYNENGLAVALDERRSFGEAVAPRVEDEVYGTDEECGCDDDATYEVACPSCGEVLYIDDGVLDEGSINCPSCGEELEFDLDGLEEENDETADEEEEEKE